MTDTKKSQLRYIKAIAKSLYELEAEKPHCTNAQLALNRLYGALWMMVLQDCDLVVTELRSIESKISKAFIESDHAAILSYATSMQQVCQRDIDYFDAE